MNDRWDLSFLYQGFDDPAFLRDMDRVEEMIAAEEQALKAENADDCAKLEAWTDAEEALSALIERLWSFVGLTLSTDATNETAARYDDKLSVLGNKASLANSAAVRFVGGLKDLDAVIAASPKLQGVAFALRDMARQYSHVLPEELEPWMLEMQLSGGSAFSQLRDKLDAGHLVDYRGEQLPLAAVRGLAYDPDPAVRRDAYEAELASYKKMELPMSYCLNSIKMEARTLARARGYESVLDMTLQESRMDRQTLDAMMGAIVEYLPHFRRYLRAKAELLGHTDGLPFCDLFAPVGKDGKTYTVEEARQILSDEFAKFNPEMSDFMRHAFDSRWIDLYPREGKSGGAFCADVHSEDRSLVLTNFQGSFSDISTLAHELGHAWHNRCMAGLPFMMTDTPMQLAETASIFNETVLAWQVLSHAAPEQEIAVLESGLMEATQTVVDIYSRFLFEQEVIDTRADHAMSVEELKDAMLRAQEASYGDGLAKDARHPYMWACKSHYYSSGLNFYNFPYAFGLLFGKGVFARWLEKGSAFLPEYNALLRACGSADIAAVAAGVGIDVRSKDFWRSSLEIIRRDIDRFCELAANK